MAEPKSTKQLTDDYLDHYVNIKRQVKSVISQPRKDDNGNIVKYEGDDGKKHIEYEWQVGVNYTLDMSNCILTDIIKSACGHLVVKQANRTRKRGREAAEALDGSVVDVRELLTERGPSKSITEQAMEMTDEQWNALVEREKERRGMK